VRAISFRNEAGRARIRLRPARLLDLLCAWLVATLLSGLPSTVYAYVTGGDVMAASRAAAAMVGRAEGLPSQVFVAAAAVHAAVSLFWAVVLAMLLPRRGTVLCALLASAGIALLDLRVIAPAWFPAVAALPIAPQLADHLMWGLCIGMTLDLRRRRRRERRRLFK
jgi:hypothetical protein